MQAISYIRYSAEKQAEGNSLLRQLDATRSYCERNGLILNDSHRLRDLGVSGFNGNNVKNGALAGFLEAVKQGKIARGTVLIIENIDRLSRDQVGDALRLFLSILGHGVHIATLMPERLYTNESVNDPSVLFEPIFGMCRAYEESSLKSKRVKAAWANKRKEVREGKRINVGKREPFWIDPKTMLPIAEKVEIVKQMFDMTLEGYGADKVAKKLNQDGHRTPKGKIWTGILVHKIVKGRAVLGEYQPGVWVNYKEVPDGDPIADYYPAIVTEETYFRAQHAIAVRKDFGKGRRDKNTRNIFTGLLFNAADGQPLYYWVSVCKTKQGRWESRKLSSRAYREGVAESDKTVIYYDPFESAFLRYVSEIRAEDLIANPSDVTNRVGELSGRLTELDHRIATAKEQYAQERKPAGQKMVLEILSGLAVEQEAARSDLERLRAQEHNQQVDTLGAVQGAARLLESASEEDAEKLRIRLRQYLKGLVHRIRVHPTAKGKGRRMKALYSLLVEVQFQDGTTRFYETDQDGRVDFNEKITDVNWKQVDIKHLSHGEFQFEGEKLQASLWEHSEEIEEE